MRYESQKTVRGNIGVSYVSQVAADEQAAQMDARNCSYCSNCSDCSDCSYCSNCSDCSGILRWRGEKASKLIAINGLKYSITTDGKGIQIGCQHHTVEQWASFTDAEIFMMDTGALEWWQSFKPTVLAMAEYRATLDKDSV